MKVINVVCICLGSLFLPALTQADTPPPSNPYEDNIQVGSANDIDIILQKNWQANGLTTPKRCSDAVFIRRIYLDLTGRLPSPAEAKTWLDSKQTDKRAALISTLLNSDDFAAYQAMKWGDVLRIKSEFPINLWPNAAQTYHRYIFEAVKNNMPYDRFARELLTASGSNFRNPQVNFYRAVADRTPSGLANAAALTFMGIRLESWPKDKQRQLTRFFTKIAFKSTKEWKEEIVYPVLLQQPLDLPLPDGKNVTVAAGTDLRRAFADYLISPENQYFSRAAANRVWFWLFGRGIINPADDLRADNPPVNPELLDYLSSELVSSRYDLKSLYRLIANSAAYQSSSIVSADPETAEKYFAAYPIRRLEAEVLSDAIGDITGIREKFTSVIPEPFSFIPPDQRAIELPDGSITSSFLIMFGRSARDSGLANERNNNISVQQRLLLFNSGDLYRRLNTMLQAPEFTKLKTPEEKTEYLYLRFFTRPPEAPETTKIVNSFKQFKGNDFWRNLAWILLNSKEFLYRH